MIERYIWSDKAQYTEKQAQQFLASRRLSLAPYPIKSIFTNKEQQCVLFFTPESTEENTVLTTPTIVES